MKTPIRINTNEQPPKPANENDTWKPVGVLVKAVVHRIARGLGK